MGDRPCADYCFHQSASSDAASASCAPLAIIRGQGGLVLTRWIGRGKTSGLVFGVESGQLRATGANLFHCRDGKVTRVLLYLDRRRAVADLGLAPEVDSPDP